MCIRLYYGKTTHCAQCNTSVPTCLFCPRAVFWVYVYFIYKNGNAIFFNIKKKYPRAITVKIPV